MLKTRVTQGSVSGVLENGYAAYKGIPYAQPLVGKLRWKSPVPAKAWKGTLKATAFKAAPCQPHDPNAPADAKKPAYSEDCLYLNVFTPATRADEKLPVMVWIHGGGFITGSAAEPPVDTYVKNGIVFASIEYRLGALGFLALPELSKQSPTGTSGNYGLQDQILGLKWIHDNIAAFGGDPNRITIFGESAGAISVSMLCGSPEAKGLFQQAISQSGGNFCPMDSVRFNNDGNRDQQGAMAHGVDYMHRMGGNSLADLMKMDANKLVNDPSTSGVGGFWPCIDGKVLVDDQYKMYQRGQFNDVNVIIGTNSDEGTMFCRPEALSKY
ncbi:MAG: carboxylesterase family protein, partial [Bacteroidales bacterium]|nr:carboxylesterase family protein [Bacteroidales bacterium]